MRMVIKNADIPDYVRPADLPEHLGGHNGTTQNDIGALEWAIKKFDIKSMVDVGCGTGRMVRMAEERGLTSMGIDGDGTIDRKGAKCLIHDFTEGPIVDHNVSYDLAWCVEFLEHIEDQYIPNFMEVLNSSKYVIATASTPGTKGYHHVNCQDQLYWVNTFEHFGLIYDRKMTLELRENSTMNIDRPVGKQYMKNMGMFFVRK